MKIDVITIFPELFEPFGRLSIVGHAVEAGLVCIAIHDLRAWAQDRHRSVDDSPYGGGPGMVMKPEPLVAAIEALAGPKGPERSARVVLLSPQGHRLDQDRMAALAGEQQLVLVCGRYEGVDQRVIELAVDEELSLGDYVLSGGEIPAMAVIEGAVRQRSFHDLNISACRRIDTSLGSLDRQKISQARMPWSRAHAAPRGRSDRSIERASRKRRFVACPFYGARSNNCGAATLCFRA